MVTIPQFSKRVVVSLLVPVFLVTQVAAPRAQIPHESPGHLESSFSLSQNSFLISNGIGKVVEHYLHKSAAQKPTIYHIRDLHAHDKAQQNIAALIESIHRQKNSGNEEPLLVLVEGASDEVDTDFFGFFPEPEIRRKTLKRSLKSGWVNGTEFLSIVKKVTVPIQIVGVEDASLYLKHFRSFRQVTEKRETSKKWINDVQKHFDDLMEVYFNEDLLRFYDLTARFDKGTITFEKFFKEIMRLKSRHSLEKGFPEITAFQEVLKRQKEIQEKELEKEKEQLILFLQNRLVKEELTTLIQKSLEYRLGRLPPSVYFKYLIVQARSLGKDFPVVAKLSVFLVRQEKIKHDRLFEELEELKREIVNTLAQSSRERKLIQLLEQFHYFRKLLLLQMNSKEWRELQDMKISIDLRIFEKELKKVFLKTDNVQEILNEAMHFYQLALERDEALYRNALREIEIKKATHAVLITGGFHSEGITQRLRKGGLEYFVILPQVENYFSEENYLKLMMDPKILSDTISFPSQFNHLMDLLNPLLRNEENIKIAQTLIRHFIANLGKDSVVVRRELQNLFLDWKSRLGETDVRKQRLMNLLEKEFKVSRKGRVAPLSRSEIKRLIYKDALTAEITIEFLKQFSLYNDPLITWVQNLYEERYSHNLEFYKIKSNSSLRAGFHSFRESLNRLRTYASMKAVAILLLISVMGLVTPVYAEEKKEVKDKEEDKYISAEASGVFGSDGDFSHTEFRVGYETERGTLNLNLGTNKLLTRLVDRDDFQLYYDSVPLIGLVGLYAGDAQSALVHLKMPQYVYYADLDLTLGDVDLVFGGQMFMLPDRVGNEYRLRPLEAAPYGGVRWRGITDWDTSIGPVDFSGNLNGKLFYQRTPADRIFNSKVFDQSGLVLDTNFEYEISRNFRVRLPSEFHANLQPWIEYLFQIAKWYDFDKNNPNYDTVYQEIEKQATRGFLYYAKLNFDSPLSVVFNPENSKLRVWGPMLFGLKLGPELGIQKGPFQTRGGGGMEVISVPQMTASAATYKEDFKDHKKALFFPWAVAIKPYGYVKAEFEQGENRASVNLELHGTNFNDGEFALGLPNPFAVKLAYEREDLFGSSIDLETFVQYRNFTDPFGYVIIPDDRVEFGLALHYGKHRPKKRISALSGEEKIEQQKSISEDDPKKDEEVKRDKPRKDRVQPLIEKLEEVGKRIEQYEKEFEEQRKPLKSPTSHSKTMNQSFFVGILGLLGWSVQGNAGEKSLLRRFASEKLIPFINKIRNYLGKNLQRLVFAVLLSLLPGCGLFTSHPYERYETVTVTEQENYVEEGSPTLWEFVTMGGIHDQSLHSDLIRGSNNAIRFKSGEIVKLYFNQGYQTTDDAKNFVTSDIFHYFSNGVSHDLVILDVDGKSYRLSIDVSGGEEKEYKISVAGLVEAALYNGINLDRLKEIQIIPTGEGPLELNGFVRNTILRLDEGAAPVNQLENFPPQVYDISTFTNLGDGILDVGDPRAGEDTTRVSWAQTPDQPEGFLLSAGEPAFNFGDSFSLNVYGMSPILYVTFRRTTGLSRTIVLGNVQPDGSHLLLTSDLIENLTVDPQGTEPFDLSLIASLEFKVNETEPGAGNFSVQGIFDDYAGRITPAPFTDAPDQDVTLLSNDGSWSNYAEEKRVSSDVNFVVAGKQGALDLKPHEGSVGYAVASGFQQLNLESEGSFQYVISGIDHDLTFTLRDEGERELKSVWEIQTSSDDPNVPIFVRVNFEDIRRDLEDGGASLPESLKIAKIDFRPHEGTLQEEEYLKLNALMPVWVSTSRPILDGDVVDYLNVTSMGPLNVSKLNQYYFNGQNPSDLENNYFRFWGLFNLSMDAGVWFIVNGDFTQNDQINIHLAADIPMVTIEMKDANGGQAYCYLLDPQIEKQNFPIQWEPSFIEKLNPSLDLTQINAVSIYADAEQLYYHSDDTSFQSGEVTFEGIVSPDAVTSPPYIVVNPQPALGTDVLDYFDVENFGLVYDESVATYEFGGSSSTFDNRFLTYPLVPSWSGSNDNLAGIYFNLAQSEEDFSARDFLTIQAGGYFWNSSNSTIVVSIKDVDGDEVFYQLAGLLPFPDMQTYVLDLSLLTIYNPEIDVNAISEILTLVNADLLWDGTPESYYGYADIKGIMNMEAMAIPTNSEGWAEKLVVKNQNGDLVNGFGQVKEAVQGRSKHMKWDFKGREINIQMDQELLSKLGMTEKEFLEFLDSAVHLDQKINHINYRGLPSKLTFALLEKSSHLFENHHGDGFIGIHRSLFDQGSAEVLFFGIYRSLSHHDPVDVLSLFKAGIIHELRHEAYPNQEIENKQVGWDARFLFEIVGENALVYISELEKRELIQANTMTRKMRDLLLNLISSSWEREGQALVLKEISKLESDSAGSIEALSNWMKEKLEEIPEVETKRQSIIKNILSVIGNDEKFSRSHEGLPRIYKWIIQERLTQRGIQNELIEEVINLFEDATFDIDLETGAIQADPVLMRTLDEILLLSGWDKKGLNVQKMVAMIKATTYVRNILEETLSEKEKIDQNEILRQIEDGKFLQNAREILGTKDVIEILTQFVIAKATGLGMEFFGEASFVLENFLETRSYELVSFHVEDEGRLLTQIKEQDPDLIERYGWDLKRILIAYRKNQRYKPFEKTVNILKSLLRRASKQEKFTLGMLLSRYDDNDIQWLNRLKKQISELKHVGETKRASLNERSLFSISERFGPRHVQPESSIFGESA